MKKDSQFSFGHLSQSVISLDSSDDTYEFIHYVIRRRWRDGVEHLRELDSQQLNLQIARAGYLVNQMEKSRRRRINHVIEQINESKRSKWRRLAYETYTETVAENLAILRGVDKHQAIRLLEKAHYRLNRGWAKAQDPRKLAKEITSKQQ